MDIGWWYREPPSGVVRVFQRHFLASYVKLWLVQIFRSPNYEEKIQNKSFLHVQNLVRKTVLVWFIYFSIKQILKSQGRIYWSHLRCLSFLFPPRDMHVCNPYVNRCLHTRSMGGISWSIGQLCRHKNLLQFRDVAEDANCYYFSIIHCYYGDKKMGTGYDFLHTLLNILRKWTLKRY